MRRILAVLMALLGFSLSACASRKSIKVKPEKTKIVAYSIGEDTLKADGILMFTDTEGEKFIIKVDDEKDGQTIIISKANEIKVLNGEKITIWIKGGEIILNDTLKINEIIKEELKELEGAYGETEKEIKIVKVLKHNGADEIEIEINGEKIELPEWSEEPNTP